jgi:hypothetical protein
MSIATPLTAGSRLLIAWARLTGGGTVASFSSGETVIPPLPALRVGAGLLLDRRTRLLLERPTGLLLERRTGMLDRCAWWRA